MASSYVEAIQNFPEDTNRYHPSYHAICRRLGVDVETFDYASVSPAQVAELFESERKPEPDSLSF